MSPGRRTTRSTIRNQQELPEKDTNVCISEPEGNTQFHANTVQPSNARSGSL